ncbi:hypothetical protein GF324_10235 [bacterium]|nr:hypothetical protein [bacterium]
MQQVSYLRREGNGRLSQAQKLDPQCLWRLAMYDVIGIGVPVTDIFIVNANSAHFDIQDPDFRRSYIAFATGSKSQVRMKVRTGGSSANTCAALAKLNYRVGYFGLLGTGHYSELLARDLMERNVDVTHILRLPSFEPGISMVISSPEGNRDRAILTDYGTGTHLNEEHFRHFMGFLTDSRWLDITSLKPKAGRSLLDFLKQIREREDRPKVFFSPSKSMLGPALEVVRDLLPYVDVFTANDEELELLTDRKRIQDSLKQLSDMGVNEAFVTRGGDGIMHMRDQEVHTIGAFPVEPEEIVNTTGAGDTVAAFFLDGLIRDLDVPTILKRAAAAGSMKITHEEIGAKEGVPTAEELDAFLEQNGDQVEVRSFQL